ncbi:hypothetical protein F4819DRAFT_457062 [Hypoxylon fuscum]|nr:hypothetical protein F4819DRAFT_457062 [Hypoxylon fuscum]
MTVASNGPDLWSGNAESEKAMYEKMASIRYQRDNEYISYANFKRRPFVLWPLYVEDEWGVDFVLAAWFATSKSSDAGVFDQMSTLVIYDPRRRREIGANQKHHHLDERFKRISGSLSTFLERGGYNTSKLRTVRGNCSPMPFDETSSGERCFANAKELLKTITDWVFQHIEQNPKMSPRPAWPALARWTLPYQARVEMTGINAWVLMSSVDFNARIAVECIEPGEPFEVVVDGNRRGLVPYDLAGPYHGPPLGDRNYLLEAGANVCTSARPFAGVEPRNPTPATGGTTTTAAA